MSRRLRAFCAALVAVLVPRSVPQVPPASAAEAMKATRTTADISIEPVGSVSGMGNAGRGVVGLLVLGLGALAATLVRGRVGS